MCSIIILFRYYVQNIKQTRIAFFERQILQGDLW